MDESLRLDPTTGTAALQVPLPVTPGRPGSARPHLAHLPDLVRVGYRSLAYWPNLGLGRSGGQVVLDVLQPFAPAESSDQPLRCWKPGNLLNRWS